MIIKTSNETIRDNIAATCETLGVNTRTTGGTENGVFQYSIEITDSEHNDEILSYFDSQIKEHDSLRTPTNYATELKRIKPENTDNIKGAKAYIGTDSEGERAFITWSLVDGKFSASGEVWNASGSDLSCGGQCIDSIAAMFPENEQAQAINKVWAKWHLNDMRAGTPRQLAAIESFKPEIERRAEVWQQVMDAHADVKATMLKRIEKAKAHKHQNIDTVYGWLVKRLSCLELENRKSQRIQYGIGEHELLTSSLAVNGLRALKITLTVQDAKLILRGEELAKIGKPSADYDTICAMLKDSGLYYDTEHMTETTSRDEITGETITRNKPYVYGSAWLTEELPAEVVKEVRGWEQVPAPSELTPLEQFINDNDCTAKFKRQFREGEGRNSYARNEWTVSINGSDFIFTCGVDSSVKSYSDPDAIQGILKSAIPCIMSDARLLDGDYHGYDDPIEYLMDELGYEEYSEAKRILTACQETAEKLGDLYTPMLAL